MLTINFKSYDESTDTFACDCTDRYWFLGAANFPITLPAVVLPYIIRDVLDECEDLPFDLIGKSVTLSHPV